LIGVLRAEARIRVLFLSTLVVVCATSLSAAAQDEPKDVAEPPGPSDTTLNFAVLRNGGQIGTSTIHVRRDGPETVADVVTHIQVKIAYVTVYRFEQTETEHWTGGSLVEMTALTDDNGAVHKVSARRQGDTLAVEADGKTSEVNPAVIPASVWNAALVRQTVALDPQDGSVTPIAVVDHGEEPLVLEGRPTTTHHYSISTALPQDLWYDEQDRLVKVELVGSDGSKIEYRPN
jgi:Family of unknown function (DUF6134)